MADDTPHSASTAPTPENPENPGNPTPPRLTFGQRAAIQALLQRVSHVIERYEQARGAPLEERLEFLRPDPPLTPAECARLDPLILELTRAANVLARAAVVAPPRPDMRGLLRGEYSLLWSDAEDTSIRRLAVYGSVSKEAQMVLGPSIERVIRAADALAALRNTQAPSPPPD